MWNERRIRPQQIKIMCEPLPSANRKVWLSSGPPTCASIIDAQRGDVHKHGHAPLNSPVCLEFRKRHARVRATSTLEVHILNRRTWERAAEEAKWAAVLTDEDWSDDASFVNFSIWDKHRQSNRRAILSQHCYPVQNMFSSVSHGVIICCHINEEIFRFQVLRSSIDMRPPTGKSNRWVRQKVLDLRFDIREHSKYMYVKA